MRLHQSGNYICYLKLNRIVGIKYCKGQAVVDGKADDGCCYTDDEVVDDFFVLEVEFFDFLHD